MVALSILVFPAMLLRRGDDVRLLLLRRPAAVCRRHGLGAASSTPPASASAARAGVAICCRLPALMGVGIGLAINNSRAVVSGLLQRGGVFERTPKYRIEQRRDGWQGKRYRVAQDAAVLVEGLLAVYFCRLLRGRDPAPHVAVAAVSLPLPAGLHLHVPALGAAGAASAARRLADLPAPGRPRAAAASPWWTSPSRIRPWHSRHPHRLSWLPCGRPHRPTPPS